MPVHPWSFWYIVPDTMVVLVDPVVYHRRVCAYIVHTLKVTPHDMMAWSRFANREDKTPGFILISMVRPPEDKHVHIIY